MSGFSARALRSLEVAREVFELLADRQIGAAVVGSVAVAVHGYPRATRDLDLGVTVLAFEPLRQIAAELSARGYETHASTPSPDDPVGGIVSVSGADFDPVEIVNLRAPAGRHAKLAGEALSSAQRDDEFGLPVVDLPQLVALKLVAGSRKDELDIIELLRANPTRVDDVVAVCGRHRLRKRLETLVAASD